MANVMLVDGANVPHTYNNVSSITLPTPDSGTVTFYASASASIDFGVETGSSLNAVYFNTRHDTTALDDYLEDASYPHKDTSLGFELPFNILISDSNSNPLVFIASLPAALNSAYIIYAMNDQTPVIFYSTAAFDASSIIPGFAVSQGWQMDYASLGVTVTIGAIENNFVAIKDNYIARSAEAYGEWISGALLAGASISPDFSDGNDTYSAPDGKVVRELTVNKPATLIPENIVKDVVIAGVTGSFAAAGKPYSFGAPTVRKNPMYNGGVQSPTLNGFFADYMTMSGTTSATEVGSYTMTFSLKDTETSQWSDGSTTPKSVTWQVTAKPAAVPYIVFSSEEPFSVGFLGGKTWGMTMEWSLDNSVWATWNGESVQASLQDGIYRLFFRGYTATFNGSSTAHFSLSGNSIYCDGAIEALINYSTVAIGRMPTISANAFQYLFYDCSNLVSAPQFYATTLASNCYQDMFYGCTSLASAPALPATTLANYCYASMFNGCSSLTSAPALPATSLAPYCYSGMFQNCTSLASAPALPATTLAQYCYSGMFYGCTSLTSAPALPATGVQSYSYQYMFQNCKSLTSAPTLPATNLSTYCYYHMFDGCTSLTSAPAISATGMQNYCYAYMFYGCTSLTSAPTLPATRLAQYCYQYMFAYCISLTSAPALPATTLTNYCYQDMFYGCTSLASAPALPATTLANYCYASMFNGCSSLTSAPALPATSLAPYCYSGMFQNCTSLASAPALPATTLAQYCYQYMFAYCISLTSAPALPATTLANYCYQYMFYNCKSLTSAPALPATTLKNSCYAYMFYGCTSLKFSSTSTGVYIYEYRIPSSGTGTTATSWNSSMFTGTGGTFKSNPLANSTYYTTNPPIAAA